MLDFKKDKNKAIFITWHFVIVYGFIFFVLSCLLSCIAWLQVINSTKLLNKSSLRIKETPTERGIIIDRRGYPLAINIPVNAVWTNSEEINNHKKDILLNKNWINLSNLLSIPLNQLFNHINNNPNVRFLYIARQVNQNISKYIKKLKLPYIYLKKESQRYYPMGEATTHLLGLTNIDNKGIEGIEKSFDKFLNGKPDIRAVRKDRNGNITEDVFLVKGNSLHNLKLSIDKRLQALAYHKLNDAIKINKAESGSVVLIDINTGEILTMTTSPSYNPNVFKKNIKNRRTRNRAITDIFEPGSTVKPMVIMAALKYGIVKKNSFLNTLPYKVDGYKIKDIVKYEKLTLTGILQKSSNVGVSHLALSMPPSVLIDIYSRFGLGKPTNLKLVGESSGLYPHKKWWPNIDRATFSFGYGLMVTPLQLARAYATIGSYGIYRPLSIIKVDSPVVGKRIFPKDLVKIVLHMMESVALPGGSGFRAAIKGYRIAIKTGTVKKVNSQGQYINKYIAYTAGVAPASNPRYALVVVINDPKAGKYYGGAVSAPVFSSIMNDVLNIMHIKPDALSFKQQT